MAFKKLNISPMIKASKYTKAADLMTHTARKYCIRQLIKNSEIPTKGIFETLHKIYISKIKEGFNELKENDLAIRL